jgi:starvation-inducible DNA-binding protein
MYPTSNDLAVATRRSVITLLNEHLADVIDLHLQAKQAHWNIKGPSFAGLHELFEQVAVQAAEYADLIAERAVALGGLARGTLKPVSRQSRLPEYPPEVGEWRAHVHAMQNALATFGRGARQAIRDAEALDDAVSADMFTEIARGVDKSLWLVEAHVQDAPVDEKHVERPPAARSRRDHDLAATRAAPRASPATSR